MLQHLAACPLRVALVSECYYPDVGGLPEHLHHLGQELARRGHKVTIVTTRFSGGPPVPAPQGAPLEVLRLGRASGAVLLNGSVSRAAVGLPLGRQLAALLPRFDVVHVHGPLFPVLPLLAVRHAPPQVAVVATLHTHFPGSLLLRALRRPLQRYLDALDAVVAVSESAADSLRRLGLHLSARVVPNGVDLEYWRGGRPLPELRDGQLNILVQARLEPRNRVDLLLEALGRLPAGAARLLVIGDGPLRGELEARVPMALRGAVRFLGARIADRPDFAHSSDVYCFTAAIASHPVSLLEGMAAGLPVVCHDIDGARGLVRPGEEGLLVPLDDPAAYAAALGALLSDETLRRRLGAAARRRAEAFAWPGVAAQIEDVYYAALRRRRPEQLGRRARTSGYGGSARGCGGSPPRLGTGT